VIARRSAPSSPCPSLRVKKSYYNPQTATTHEPFIDTLLHRSKQYSIPANNCQRETPQQISQSFQTSLFEHAKRRTRRCRWQSRLWRSHKSLHTIILRINCGRRQNYLAKSHIFTIWLNRIFFRIMFSRSSTIKTRVICSRSAHRASARFQQLALVAPVMTSERGAQPQGDFDVSVFSGPRHRSMCSGMFVCGSTYNPPKGPDQSKFRGVRQDETMIN